MKFNAAKLFATGCGLIIFGLFGVPVLLVIIVAVLMALGVNPG